MPEYTENYGLAKPYEVENYDINVHNDNMDKIDDAIKDINDDLTQHKLDYIQQRQQDNLKVAKVEKDLTDYQKTLSQVNVNQEAKQRATGYGVVNLPKNAANGQVSATIKGNTETDEDGNTKSTVSASRLKSVGKNLFDKSKIIQGEQVGTTTGRILTASNYNRSTFFRVEENTYYTRTLKNSPISPQHYISWFNKDCEYISRTPTTRNEVLTNLSPIGAVYGILSYPSAIDENHIQIEKGNRSTDYEPYTESNAYVVAKDGDEIAELRSLPNGTKDEVSVSDGKLIKRVSDEVVLNGSEDWKTDSSIFTSVYKFFIDKPNNSAPSTTVNATIGGISLNSVVDLDGDYEHTYIGNSSLIFYIAKSKIDAMIGATTVDKFKAYINQYPITLTYQLAEPVEIPIEVSGTLVGHPNGTVYVEPVVADAGIYADGMAVLHQDLPIKAIEKVSKVDFVTGLETELDIEGIAIAEDKFSFTHPDLSEGDIVFFEYEYDLESTQGETEIEYYDSRYVLKDSVTGKFYKVVPTVADGVLSNTLVEV